MDYKQEYVRYKHVLYGTYKSPKFEKWLGNNIEQFFDKKYSFEKDTKVDLHHTLIRSIDYLMMPAGHFFHLEVVHKNRQKYFVEYLPMSLKILTFYAFEMYGVKMEHLDKTQITPELVKQMIETVYKLDNEGK